MPDKISFDKIIELKNTLEEKFDIKLSIIDIDSEWQFSLDNSNPSGLDYIKNYFEEKSYIVNFNEDFTEFYIEKIKMC